MKTEKRIYLDYAATTPVDEEVLRAMESYRRHAFSNPGGLYKEGVAAKNAVAEAREKIARLIGARPEEIVFTSGGTEANNLAILGLFKYLLKSGNKPNDFHFVTSTIEHASVLDVFGELERRGSAVSYVGVTKEGIVREDELRALLTFQHSQECQNVRKEELLCPNTALVSIMYANNEIGTIQPIAEIVKSLRNFRKVRCQVSDVRCEKLALPIFHVDASNVLSYLPINIQKLGVDMMTLDAQKVYGPKGIGVLYVKKGIALEPLFYGGGQEGGLRPGTEPVPLIIGMAKALELAAEEREKESKRLTKLRDYFIAEVLKKIPDAELNGDPKERLPNNVNFSFPFNGVHDGYGQDSEWLALQLDARGIAVGTRSACLTQKEGGSYVVAALGKGKQYSTSTLRFTLGKSTTKKEIEYVIEALVEIIDKEKK